MSANFWNERYAVTEDFYYGTSPNDFLKEHSNKISSGGNVLSIGEGEGRNAIYLAEMGLQVTALDASSVGLTKMDILAKQRNVSIKSVIQDLSEYKIAPISWNGIISIWCHIPKSLRKIIYPSIVKGLKPGGVFILEAYHPRQLSYKSGGPSDVDLLLTLKDLHEDLDELDFIFEAEIDRDISEGKGHLGKSAVTQVVCRKKN